MWIDWLKEITYLKVSIVLLFAKEANKIIEIVQRELNEVDLRLSAGSEDLSND